MKKMVDGKVVDMSAEEIAQRAAEDAIFAAGGKPRNAQSPTAALEEKIARLELAVAALEARQK